MTSKLTIIVSRLSKQSWGVTVGQQGPVVSTQLDATRVATEMLNQSAYGELIIERPDGSVKNTYSIGYENGSR